MQPSNQMSKRLDRAKVTQLQLVRVHIDQQVCGLMSQWPTAVGTLLMQGVSLREKAF